MDDRVWVGPASRCPLGWLSVESMEALFATPINPAHVVVDDPAGVLREADFLQLYGHAPLSRIERVVGPWRSGVGRTDPQWPLGSLRRQDDLPESTFSEAPTWPPLTAGYEDLSGCDVIPDMTGLSYRLEISDPELRAMWADWLTLAGGQLTRELPVDVLICEDSADLNDAMVSAAECIVVLSPAPWNTGNSLHSLAGHGAANEQPFILAASVLDSPARVTQRALDAVQRATL